jgi:hypothetical protein
MVAARLANISGKGRPDKNALIEAFSQERAAEMLNVGRSAVQQGRLVLIDGVDELPQAVDRDWIAVSLAAKLSSWPPEFQQMVLDLIRKEGIKASEAMRRIKALMKTDAGLENPIGKYRVFYADPPFLRRNRTIELNRKLLKDFRIETYAAVSDCRFQLGCAPNSSDHICTCCSSR